MAKLYLPKNSNTWRINYWNNNTGRSTSISCRTQDEEQAKKVFKEFLEKSELNITETMQLRGTKV